MMLGAKFGGKIVAEAICGEVEGELQTGGSFVAAKFVGGVCAVAPLGGNGKVDVRRGVITKILKPQHYHRHHKKDLLESHVGLFFFNFVGKNFDLNPIFLSSHSYFCQ